MQVLLTDAHCHSDFLEDMSSEKVGSGVSICANACFPAQWQSLSRFDSFPIKKAYGIHPDLQISELDNIEKIESELFVTLIPELKKYLSKADAIGETGLDETIEARVHAELQKKVFLAQLELAREFSLPLIIHCVGKWGALFDVLKTSFAKGSGQKFLIHAAKCSSELAVQFEKIGGYFSFGLRELNSAKGSACAKIVNDTRIMVETDAEVSPEILTDTICKLAEIRNENVEELSKKIRNNFMEFYSK